MVETLERVHCVVTSAIPMAGWVSDSLMSLTRGFPKQEEEQIGEFDADILIATDGAFVLEVPRSDERLFPCSRWDRLNLSNGDRLRVLGMSLITHGVHRWQIIAERLEV